MRRSPESDSEAFNWAIVREPTILATAAVYGLLLWIAANAGLFGIWLGILVFISLWRYCYTVQLEVAGGHSRIAPPDIGSMNPVGGSWTYFWHWVCFPGLVLATLSIQPLGTLVALIAAMSFPASAAIVGATSSLAQAFNPAAIVHFARRLGRDYWLLVLGVVGIIVGTLAVDGFLLPALSRVPVLGFFAGMLSYMIMIWALLSVFALIGSALRVLHFDFEIGGEVVDPEDRERERRHADWHRMLDIAYGSFRSGILVSGYKTLHQLVASNGDSIEVNYWLVENMIDWEDKKYALEVATKLFPRLLARGDAAGALQLYHRCRRRDPEFRPAAQDAGRIGEFAASIGQPGIAAELGYNPQTTRAIGTGSQP